MRRTLGVQLDPREHIALVDQGVSLHEQRRYAEALPILERAFHSAPRCPDAIYNLANTLHMLDRDHEALQLLSRLVGLSDEQLRHGCPAGRADVRSIRLDAYYLLFLVTLYGTGSWTDAYPYAQEHLALRQRGVRSAWSRREVIREIRDLASEFVGDA